MRTAVPGVATGLAVTGAGGDVLYIEASLLRGARGLRLTGQLGEVMKESAQAAFSYIRSHAEQLGIDPNFGDNIDIHVHIPEGAIPKDGPSAGVALSVALLSAVSKRPVLANLAMTGEITLRGQVLPIGGLKEKLLAARRAGIRDVIIPDENARELSEIPKSDYEDMSIHMVHWIDEVFELALTKRPKPLMDDHPASVPPSDSSSEETETGTSTHH